MARCMFMEMPACFRIARRVARHAARTHWHIRGRVCRSVGQPSETYRERMLSHIVGFEIAVTKIEAKFKLSQNRTKEEQSNVIDSLGKADDTTVAGVARLMREQGLGVKKEDRIMRLSP